MSESREPESAESADGPASREDGDAPGNGAMSASAQWLVVLVLLVSGVLAPAFLYFVDPTAFGLPFRDTYLVVPLVPAVLLGAVGVWTAVRDG